MSCVLCYTNKLILPSLRAIKSIKSDILKYLIISDNPGKNYRGQRVRQTKLDVFLQNKSPKKLSPPTTPISMLLNQLNILLKLNYEKQHWIGGLGVWDLIKQRVKVKICVRKLKCPHNFCQDCLKITWNKYRKLTPKARFLL